MSEQVAEHAGSAVSKKLGPLPVWAYALIIAGVAWGFYYWRSHSVSGGNAVVNSAVPPVDAASVAGASGVLPSTYSGIVQTTPGTPSLGTNAQWAKYAADQLNALGYAPDAVANALSGYVNGTALDAQGQSLINIALQKFGTPPQGVMPVAATPANPQDAGYVGHKYTVQAGDTVQSVITKFYGAWNPVTARLVNSDNAGKIVWNEQAGNYDPLKAGDVLYLGNNGIAGYQPNSLNTYDAGHTIDPKAESTYNVGLPSGAKVV